MSISPQTKKDEGVKTNLGQRITQPVKQTINGFFTRPAYYLFYGTLTTIVIGLVCGQNFSFLLYVFLAIISLLYLIETIFHDKH